MSLYRPDVFVVEFGQGYIINLVFINFFEKELVHN